MVTSEWQIDDAQLQRAQQVIARYALQSPMIPAPWLGTNVWLKLELEQPTGSFKVRGGVTRLAELSPDERRAGVVAASAGNHGLGLAYAARELGVSLKVFVPATAPEIKVTGMRALGAHVELGEASSYDEVEAIARRVAKEEGAVFVSPFDEPLVAAGNGGTLGLELLDAIPRIDRIVVPAGGGGLLVGVAAACASRGASARIIAVESDVSDALGQSLASGTTVTQLAPRGPTLAEGLEGGISASTHALAAAANVEAVTVSEEEIALAMVFASKKLGRPVEGSAAAAIAWVRRLENQSDATTVVVVTGSNVDAQRLVALEAGWRPS